MTPWLLLISITAFVSVYRQRDEMKVYQKIFTIIIAIVLLLLFLFLFPLEMENFDWNQEPRYR